MTSLKKFNVVFVTLKHIHKKIIYQVGCGIHECEDCDMRVKFLNDIKTHIDK